MNFLESARKRFIEYKTLGDKTFAQLTDEELTCAPAEDSNSLATIIRHLHGNMKSRWTDFLTTDGEKEGRQREAEFGTPGGSRTELLELWEEGWAVLLQTLASLRPDDLEKIVTIRSQPLTVTDAILRQLAHYSYHVGQIVYLGKWLRSAQWTYLSIPPGGTDRYNAELSGQ